MTVEQYIFAALVVVLIGLSKAGFAGGTGLLATPLFCLVVSPHQAVGVLQDRDGDDFYWAVTAASQGAAWDAAIGIIEDRSGDDRYRGQELSQGAAAMNGLGLLYDWSGKDRYYTRSGQGLGSSASYWGGRGALNLGMIIDAGGQPDSYNLAGKENHTTSRSPGIGLFQDR